MKDTTTSVNIHVPMDLHEDSKKLVIAFSEELATKLRNAEKKYGYSNKWYTDDWESECRSQLVKHLLKGDPRDVAIYCAFMWCRGWSLKPIAESINTAMARVRLAYGEFQNLFEG